MRAVVQRIFAGLSISGRVSIDRAVIKINPYDPATDQLSMLGNGKTYQVVASMDEANGQLIIVNPGTQVMNLSEWDSVINFPAYRLNIDDPRPFSCANYIRGRYPRTFSMHVVDRFGRHSNTITRKLDVQTG